MAEDIKNELEQPEGEIVVLEDENGNEVKFLYVATLDHNDKEYVCLQCLEGEDQDVLEIYEIESYSQEDKEFDSLTPVDDELYEVLYEKLINLHDEECHCGCHEDGCDCDGDCDCDEEDCCCCDGHHHES